MNIRLPIWVIGKRILSGRYLVEYDAIGHVGMFLPRLIKDGPSDENPIRWNRSVYSSYLSGVYSLSEDESEFLDRCTGHVRNIARKKEDMSREREFYERIMGKRMKNK